jgi:hypothetical protein
MEVTYPPSLLFIDEKTASISDLWLYFFIHSFLFSLYCCIISANGLPFPDSPVDVFLGLMKGVPPLITIAQQLLLDKYPLSAYTFPSSYSGSRSGSSCVASWTQVLVK